MFASDGFLLLKKKKEFCKVIPKITSFSVKEYMQRGAIRHKIEIPPRLPSVNS